MVTSCFHTLFVLSERNVREDETVGHLSMFFRRVKEKRCRVVGTGVRLVWKRLPLCMKTNAAARIDRKGVSAGGSVLG